MTRTLAFRRHQSQLKKTKVSHYNVACDARMIEDPNTSLEKYIGQLATTPKFCSCHMCGNPRKHWGTVSIQEKRSILA